MDNRIKLSSGLVSFDTVGQDHDAYPAPGQQARYDHLRSYLIGVLTNQSSADEPSEFREGTPWFDLNSMTLKIRYDGSWVELSKVISTNGAASASNVIRLDDWIDGVNAALTTISPEIVFSGTCSNVDVTQIPIPETIRTNTLGQSIITSNSRAMVWVNGIMLNPNRCSLQNVGTLLVLLDPLQPNDRFTVSIKTIPSRHFYTNSIQV